jgi:hypothetical protein
MEIYSNVKFIFIYLLYVGARFRIIFFAQIAQLWQGTKLLARQLLLYHLRTNTQLAVDIPTITSNHSDVSMINKNIFMMDSFPAKNG